MRAVTAAAADRGGHPIISHRGLRQAGAPHSWHVFNFFEEQTFIETLLHVNWRFGGVSAAGQ